MISLPIIIIQEYPKMHHFLLLLKGFKVLQNQACSDFIT